MSSESPQGPSPRTIAFFFVLPPLVMGLLVFLIVLRYELEFTPLAVGLIAGLLLSIAVAFAVFYVAYSARERE